MNVAPDTMSMSALWASRVSELSTGTARELISWSLPLLHGTWVTSASVIFPFFTVILTCTSP